MSYREMKDIKTNYVEEKEKARHSQYGCSSGDSSYEHKPILKKIISFTEIQNYITLNYNLPNDHL